MHAQLSKPPIIALLIGWPIVVYLAGPSPGIAVTSLLLYGVIAWVLRLWAPLVGTLFGLMFGFVLILGGTTLRPGDAEQLLFVFSVIGTIVGAFAREMKRLDDAHLPQAVNESATNRIDTPPAP